MNDNFVTYDEDGSIPSPYDYFEKGATIPPEDYYSDVIYKNTVISIVSDSGKHKVPDKAVVIYLAMDGYSVPQPVLIKDNDFFRAMANFREIYGLDGDEK